MAEQGTLCINADVVLKAGTNVNATAIIEASTNNYIKQAEGFVCLNSEYDWVTNYASVSTIGKEELRNITSSLAAFYAINYDQSGFSSRTEAQVMLDVCWQNVVEGINLINQDNYKTFVLEGEN